MNRSKQVQYTIGELGRHMRLPVTTLRYYERAGLLQPDRRNGARYRIYGERAIMRLTAIRRAQTMGFSCREILELLKLDANMRNSCSVAHHICQAKLTQLRDRIAMLQIAVRELRRLSKTCGDNGSDSRCAILRGIFDVAIVRGGSRTVAAR